ncbi:nucleoside/nucleotide kinase family protein [Verminephrobacter aporrectodeae subsp. tuberculatae]|uniref:Nucleoside/nucleotide kinase family protein n=1 Tax=Verminephrobacter aporrectodeae subsp. tuberculatae TaxID=1110392 RepID=A0ABT3KNB4_9BURK|nr:nucleoside/nucleotide kinase family protein [Verminephrobacter aporrectodeae]MCW5319799.1 nucleoside/nucleotide kinase family protein [Verminephrobacter aporrectodeae subsp. tuberculatae]
MTQHVQTLTLAQACGRLQLFLSRSSRTILGIVGPPGAGKSTVSLRLHALYPQQSQIVPMDGYHLANKELDRLGRAGRKGAPDTFDGHGYRSLLERLRKQGDDELIYAPEFRREIEEPIAGAIPIFPHAKLLIAEGNYLALEQGGWGHVAALLDELWYVEVDPALRLQRLLARHMQFGRSRQAAEDWVREIDEPNARLIESTLARAHFKVRAE